MTHLSKIPIPHIEPIGVKMEHAELLTGISRPLIYALSAEGALTIYQDGRRAIVDYAELLKALEHLPRRRRCRGCLKADAPLEEPPASA